MNLMQNIPPIVQKFAADKYGPGTTVKIDTSPYWSTVRFAFTLAGVLAVSTRQAFSYAIGGDRTPAGYAAGSALATMADTNLQKAGETRLNADIFVGGIAGFITPDSDAALASRVCRECAVTLSTDGQSVTPLATLEMIPAGGGFQGPGRSAIKTPPFDTAGVVDAGPGAPIAFANNGFPIAGNYLQLDSPVLWTGRQGVDSNFRLNFNIDRQINENVGAARAAAAGVAAFTPPVALGDLGTFVDLRVRLYCWAISKPSLNG